ncbi:hypothetical protein VTN77DRAFT_813 [Rasamsonia byssochlamydoides]|uniref:uncharacterized protein n=1 Tax=Rasamsonia byssochlamydoides TaxID=89139 RepID=UPI0037432CC3
MRRRKVSTMIDVVRLGLWILILATLASTDAVVRPDATNTEREQRSDIADASSLICPAKEFQSMSIQLPICLETRWGKGKSVSDDQPSQEDGSQEHQPTVMLNVTTTSATSSDRATPTASTATHTDQELDTESPLDNANFLSFEDWKKQNLAKIGQSAENVGGRRQNRDVAREHRRRAGTINNALDSLGDDSEIELDFGGFGTEAPENTRPSSWGSDASNKEARKTEGGEEPHEGMAEGVSQRGVGKRKDAGTTCKERFNYASFDCAATVLKTNPECTGSSSVLIENKDSYMLNECSAENKFLILELCDDILIDTIVLANYEFFSSIFRTFRVSVSDRYPVKADKWRELGVFEARNTREVQAFAIENPLIWARYVKIEFLTHYGNEFYCPVSLVRVHGTTMMEEYKNDGEISRADEEGGDDAIEPVEAPVDGERIQTVNATEEVISHENATTTMPTLSEWLHRDISLFNRTAIEEALLRGPTPVIDMCSVDEAPPDDTAWPTQTRSVTTFDTADATSVNATLTDPTAASSESASNRAEQAGGNVTVSSHSSLEGQSSGDRHPATETETRPAATNTKEDSSAAGEPTKSVPTQPASPNPTTQESFFKSVNKRLQMLESNSSLSLMYIEEQSRILRDAFNKVEKRQLAKTSTFLENLNTTVLNELREFRSQYDQVWRSVAIEFEKQRFQYHQEIYSITTQLGVLADELVFQKRVSVIQSIFVLICFGLVLFSRGSGGTYIEFPSVQSMVTRSHSLRSSSPIFGTPLASPGSTGPTSSLREKRGHRRNPSEDSQEDPISPTISYSPPTPPSEEGASRSESDDKLEPTSPDSSRLPTPEPPHVRPGSSPPTFSGSRKDSASEDEGVDSSKPTDSSQSSAG